jgi:hypothetical protein
MGGLIGGKIQRDLKLGMFSLSEEDHLHYCSVGGINSCKINGWKDPLIQSENGKRGGPKNKGFRWYHDKNGQQFKYTKKQQEVEDFESFLIRTGLKRGRK